jgi:hypothetical protein
MFLKVTEWKGAKLITFVQNLVQRRGIVNMVTTHTGYRKVREFIDHLSNYQPLQNNLIDRRVILVHYRFAKLEELTNNLLKKRAHCEWRTAK